MRESLCSCHPMWRNIMHIAAMRNNKDDYDKCDFNKTHNHYPPPKRKTWMLVHFPMGGGQYVSPPCRKRNGQPLNTGTRKLRRTATLIILAIFTLHSEKYFTDYHIRVSSLQGQPSWTTAAGLLVGLPSLFDNLSNNHCIIWKNRQTSGPKSYSYPPPTS